MLVSNSNSSSNVYDYGLFSVQKSLSTARIFLTLVNEYLQGSRNLTIIAQRRNCRRRSGSRDAAAAVSLPFALQSRPSPAALGASAVGAPIAGLGPCLPTRPVPKKQASAAVGSAVPATNSKSEKLYPILSTENGSETFMGNLLWAIWLWRWLCVVVTGRWRWW
ncbi:unnamed protein product [Fraxinus pennsylvanica]|uniref:Uncharacterized protein n=1 Tax=Fraxinus pennsylvanica TaxID=56036 RepID=A0AAD1ZU32_9LAMI|nr:unnamed protein product [Fraxinus pennsylvanica]